MATKKNKIKKDRTPQSAASPPGSQTLAGRAGPGRFAFDPRQGASLSSLSPVSRPYPCLCRSLSLRFSHLWIKSANPRCDNVGMTPSFQCAIHALRRHRLLLQRLDTHAAVVQTRGRAVCCRTLRTSRSVGQLLRQIKQIFVPWIWV